MTIEDEEKPPLGERVQAALDVARELARYGGLMNVLIHPDITGHKLQFERDFITALKPVAWFGTVNDFATWWAARNEVAVDVELSANFAAVTLTADLGGQLDGEIQVGAGDRETVTRQLEAQSGQYGKRTGTTGGGTPGSGQCFGQCFALTTELHSVPFLDRVSVDR